MSLTPNVCAGLLDETNNRILFSTPVVKVVAVADGQHDIRDFERGLVATIVDGSGAHLQIVLPQGYKTWSAANGGTGASRDVAENDTIRIQQMLRLSDGTQNVIVAYSVEIDNGDVDVPLEITNYEDKITELRRQLEQANARLATLLAEKGVGKDILEAVMQMVEQFNSLVENSMSE